MSINVTHPDGRFQELMEILHDKKRINNAAAAGALPVLQEHFISLSSTNRNPFGVRSTFWNRMLSGTISLATDDAAILRMPAEVGLRYHGGTVTPKASKYLAIPARAEAYGKSPRDFTDLRAIALKEGGLVLIQDKGADEGVVMYWLVRQATIRENKAVLPTEAELIEGAEEGLESLLELIS